MFLQRLYLTGGRGSWEYILEVGGSFYDNDEIPNNLSISSSCNSDGLTVGICGSSTISGTLKYKYGILQRNSPVVLFRKTGEEITDREIIGQWFISEYNILEDETSFDFVAVDAMAFADNPYDMTDKFIGMQFNEAETALSSLGISVQIDRPNTAILNLSTENSAGWSIRDLISYCAMLEGKNYYAVPISEYGAKYKKIFGDYISVSADNYSLVSYGQSDALISKVVYMQTETEYPVKLQNYIPEREEGEPFDSSEIFIDTPEFHNVFEYIGSVAPNDATMLKFVNPLVIFSYLRVSAPADVSGSGETPDTTITTTQYTAIDSIIRNTANALIGHSFGTPFSCENVLVDKILSPLCQINFATLSDKIFYVSSANYKLTTNGIYASVSGSGRSLSDYNYAGKTEKEMRERLKVGKYYGNSMIDNSFGVTWNDRLIERRVDSG